MHFWTLHEVTDWLFETIFLLGGCCLAYNGQSVTSSNNQLFLKKIRRTWLKTTTRSSVQRGYPIANKSGSCSSFRWSRLVQDSGGGSWATFHVQVNNLQIKWHKLDRCSNSRKLITRRQTVIPVYSRRFHGLWFTRNLFTSNHLKVHQVLQTVETRLFSDLAIKPTWKWQSS